MRTRTAIAIFLLLAGAACRTPAGTDTPLDLSAVRANAERDVRAAAEELAAQRDRVAEARRPLAAETEALHHDVAELRANVRNRRQDQARIAVTLERLDADIASMEADLAGVDQALAEYRRASETRMHRAESLARADTLSALDGRFGPDRPPADLPENAEVLWTTSLDWALERLGGLQWQGDALGVDGLVLTGRYLAAGPAVWFVEADGPHAGLVITRPGSALPSLAPRQPARYGPALRAVAEGEEAVVPVDPGDALRRIEARTGWVQQARAGGAVMIPLAILAVVALGLTVLKIRALARVDVDGGARIPDLVKALRQGDRDQARALAESAGLPLRPVLIEGVTHADADRAHLEELLHERVLSALPLLERHLGTLAVLGGVAPLLGLLGTVTGMIHTFQLITLFGTGDARLLSGGISEALVTTQFGLFIAIPTLLAHAYLVRRVRDLVGRLEDAAVAFVHGLKVKG